MVRYSAVDCVIWSRFHPHFKYTPLHFHPCRKMTFVSLHFKWKVQEKMSRGTGIVCVVSVSAGAQQLFHDHLCTGVCRHLFSPFIRQVFFFLLLLSSSPQYLWIYSVGDSAFFNLKQGSLTLIYFPLPPRLLPSSPSSNIFFFPRALISNVERSQTSNQRWYGIFIQILHLSVTPVSQYKMSIVTLVLINQTSTSWLDAACHW